MALTAWNLELGVLQPGRGDVKPGEALNLPAIARASGGPV